MRSIALTFGLILSIQASAATFVNHEARELNRVHPGKASECLDQAQSYLNDYASQERSSKADTLKPAQTFLKPDERTVVEKEMIYNSPKAREDALVYNGRLTTSDERVGVAVVVGVESCHLVSITEVSFASK